MYLTLEEIRRGENGKTGVLDLIRGSQYLVWYFRALGSQIGDNVCLYPNGGDPMMTEPDLVTIHDGAGVDDASLIAHINTRGIFRLNPLSVGKNCVLKSNTRLLSGAQMSDYSLMLEHTLVLAGDVVDSGSVWQGWPSSTHISLEVHRKNLSYLVNKAVFSAPAMLVSSDANGSVIATARSHARRLENEAVVAAEEERDLNQFYRPPTTSAPAEKRKRVSFMGDQKTGSPLSETTPLLSNSHRSHGTKAYN